MTQRADMPDALEPQAARATCGRRGVALLEVVLALGVFFSMAIGVLGSLNVCVRSARRVRLEAQAADLAITLLSEVQLGVVAAEDAGPEPYEDEALEGWTWQVTVTPVQSSLTEMDLSRVELTICNTTAGHTHRLYHLLTLEPEAALETMTEEPL